MFFLKKVLPCWYHIHTAYWIEFLCLSTVGWLSISKQPWPLFCLFSFFSNTNFTEKNCRLHRDSNLDRWSRRRPRWQLDHHYVPLTEHFVGKPFSLVWWQDTMKTDQKWSQTVKQNVPTRRTHYLVIGSFYQGSATVSGPPIGCRQYAYKRKGAWRGTWKKTI